MPFEYGQNRYNAAGWRLSGLGMESVFAKASIASYHSAVAITTPVREDSRFAIPTTTESVTTACSIP